MNGKEERKKKNKMAAIFTSVVQEREWGHSTEGLMTGHLKVLVHKMDNRRKVSNNLLKEMYLAPSVKGAEKRPIHFFAGLDGICEVEKIMQVLPADPSCGLLLVQKWKAVKIT